MMYISYTPTYHRASDQSLRQAQQTRVLCETDRGLASHDRGSPARFSPPTLLCSATTTSMHICDIRSHTLQI